MSQVTDRPQKITLREMRQSGVRGILIYSADNKCSNEAIILLSLLWAVSQVCPLGPRR